MRNVSLFDLYDGNEASANLIGILMRRSDNRDNDNDKTAVVIYLCYKI